MASSMQRRESILALAYQHGFVEVSRLSDDLNVSEATVRRDLHSLARDGQLELTHGGATVVRQSDYSFMSKATRNTEAKRVVAQLACTLIEDGDLIFLDSGTTCFEMTRFLRGKRRLSVIVSSIRIAQELYAPGINVILLGGHYRPDRSDAVGPMASASLERLRGYRTFFGSDGVAMDFGPASIDIDSASLFGQAVAHAKQAVLVVDSSKLGSSTLYRIAKWNQVSTVVTDTRPDDAWVDFFHDQGIEVVTPEETGNDSSDLSTGG